MKNKVLIAIIALYALIMFMAPFIAGKNDLTPRVLKNTWESESVSLSFSGRDKVTVSNGSVTVEGNYVNGTTGTTMVIWFDLGENCPEELKFLESSREEYLTYTVGEDATGNYMEIDGTKYYKN